MQRLLSQSGGERATALVVLATFGAADAAAHVQLVSTSPKAGSTVRSVSSVKLTFSGVIRSGTVRVTGPGGTKVSKGNGGRDPRNVKRLAVSLRGGLKSGTYRVSASIAAGDGHAEQFSYSFKLKK